MPHNIKLHNCENCGVNFEYENDINNYYFSYDFNLKINCPVCKANFFLVLNELNDFSYLEFSGINHSTCIDYIGEPFLVNFDKDFNEFII